MEAYMIPKHLDEPERWMFWTVDEALVMLGPTIGGMLSGYLLVGAGVGIGGFLFLRRVKGNGQANLGLYALYWFFPNVFRFKATPPSSVRRYV
jgi:conjugal transfer pilus assembly protein TraL